MAYNVVEVHLYDDLPKYKVVSVRGPGVWKIEGVDYDEAFVSTRSISTYPYLPSGEKDGDPIADRLFVQLHENRALVAVADGCNWGRRPQMAARDAVDAVSVYLTDKQSMIRDLQDAGHYLLRSFSEAHKKIVSGKEDIWEAGTTTLLSALCLELEPAQEGEPQWGILCASVGDCKAFVCSKETREVIDVTSGNRNNVVDGRDPGGRLGPYIGEHGWPDLRNLRLYFCPCEPEDIVLIMSDGVHDNLDPQTLGRVPSDLNISVSNGSSWKSWDEIPHDSLVRVKSDFMKKMLGNIVFGGEDPSPVAVTGRLIQHCTEVTRKAREFMENNPNKKQPTDYIEFPGKMDHTTCVTFVVGLKGSASSSSSSSSSSIAVASSSSSSSAAPPSPSPSTSSSSLPTSAAPPPAEPEESSSTS